ncbi:Clp protease N-terminal domain-containing protein [Nonomuraea pusilla]|uniref:Clp amino terminal domain-containing protein, pathogenicity island component n=1 Tax=Nonomuraea pusilla TaxID=46177 RepID=A0A1H7ITR1_9ACTN|nr:Clp protease N-terminal domain-containing protein [Nonomuraea pusilla]SEK65861.1 Clp amino terminal domain-containing protein, pathogenicity island component [Nonomuraea pusilla]
MPKINVYLPDELAEAVKEAGVPVSAICQRALEQAVRRITTIRQAVLTDLEDDDLGARLPHFTARARAVVKLAVRQARAESAPAIGTGHLLAAMVAEGENLALHVLRAVDIDPDQARRDLRRHTGSKEDGPGKGGAAEGRRDGGPEESAREEGGTGRGASEPGVSGSSGQAGPGEAAPGEGASVHFDGPAAAALELAVTEATALGHNYVGCEHLLLGLVTEPDGVAGEVLRTLGAEPRLTRRAVTAALAGYVHLRAQTAAASASTTSPPADPAQALAEAVRHQLQPLVERIENLERHLAPKPTANPTTTGTPAPAGITAVDPAAPSEGGTDTSTGPDA